MDRSPSSDLVADYKQFQLAEVETECISSSMKIFAARCLIAVVVVAAASSAFANPFKTKIITGASSALVITVPDGHFLKITNFSQEGGTDRGVVEVTLQGDSESGGPAHVLTATLVDLNSPNAPEITNRVIIAGPAEVRIRPIPGATLFITYRKESNEGAGGGGGGGTVTPIPIVSPTPTATP
jgi:hypothetical protein